MKWNKERQLCSMTIVLVFALFVLLKTSGIVDLPWFWVFSPIWGSVGIIILMLAAIGFSFV